MALYAGVVFLLLLIGVSSGVYDNDKVSAMDDDDLYEQLVDLQRRHVDWLLDHPDVTGVDVNYKKVGGEHTDQLSLVIGVKEKLTDDALTHERRLPKHIEGFQTDIIEEELAVATQVDSVNKCMVKLLVW